MKPEHQLIKYFEFAHLPEKLRYISQFFQVMAQRIDMNLPDGLMKDVALQRLLESKDAAVRAALELPDRNE